MTNEPLADKIRATIREIPDFPEQGIRFKDITPLLASPKLSRDVTDYFASRYRDDSLDYVIAIESRGFIFGAPLAQKLGVGLILARKPGKLPRDTVGVDYALEYGTDRIELHRDSLQSGDRVAIVDDILATGGTANATRRAAEKLGADVLECGFVIELSHLEGRQQLDGCEVEALVSYDE